MLSIFILAIGYGFYSPSSVELIEQETKKFPYVWIVLYPIVLGALIRSYYDKKGKHDIGDL